MRKVVFLFPGQGVQYYHMGYPLYQQCPVFKSWLERSRDIIYNEISIDILNELYSPNRTKADRFDNLLITQTALIVVTTGIAKSLESEGLIPDLLLGTSLGEISASVFSGAFTLESVLPCVIDHVKEFTQKADKGCMIALFDVQRKFDIATVAEYGFQLCAENFPGAYVIGGTSKMLPSVEVLLQKKQIMYEVLPIEIAFHTYMIDACKDSFINRLRKFEYVKPRYPVFSSAKIDYIREYNHEYFWSVVRDPIQYMKAIQVIEASDQYQYIDVGPSGSLASFLQFILKEGGQSKAKKFLTPFTNSISKEEFVTSINKERNFV